MNPNIHENVPISQKLFPNYSTSFRHITPHRPLCPWQFHQALLWRFSSRNPNLLFLKVILEPQRCNDGNNSTLIRFSCRIQPIPQPYCTTRYAKLNHRKSHSWKLLLVARYSLLHHRNPILDLYWKESFTINAVIKQSRTLFKSIIAFSFILHKALLFIYLFKRCLLKFSIFKLVIVVEIIWYRQRLLNFKTEVSQKEI